MFTLLTDKVMESQQTSEKPEPPACCCVSEIDVTVSNIPKMKAVHTGLRFLKVHSPVLSYSISLVSVEAGRWTGTITW